LSLNVKAAVGRQFSRFDALDCARKTIPVAIVGGSTPLVPIIVDAAQSMQRYRSKDIDCKADCRTRRRRVPWPSNSVGGSRQVPPIRQIGIQSIAARKPRAQTDRGRVMRLPTGITASFTLAAALVAYGGGDQPKRAPSISNLNYAPATVYFNQGGGTATISGTLDFQDDAGAIGALRITTSTGSDQTIPTPGLTGHNSGTIQGTFDVSTSSVSDFTFKIWIVDGAGLSSNQLPGTFSVRYDDTAAHWSTQVSGTSSALRKVVWTGVRYVAVGDGGVILTSSDGVAWTAQASPTASNLNGLVWTGTALVAVGSGGAVLTSADGLTWTSQTSRIADTLYSVTWSGTQYVATGASIDIVSDAPLLTSPDAVTWTRRASGLAGWNLFGIAWSGSQFVVVGDAQFNPAANTILTSMDGASWAKQVILVGNAQFLFDVAWSGAKFVAVGPASTVAISTDGLSWQVSNSSNLGTTYGVTWDAYGSQFVTVGNDVNKSSDGVAWTRIGQVSMLLQRGIVWGTDKFVVVGDSGLIMTSP
jgi:hypothetical protein